jgi:predicted HD superfamily hydrolase involved in NAD metabolism
MTGSYDGIYERARPLLEKRLDGYRLQHSLAAAETAAALAERYDVDVAKARVAGLLHDWDKGLDDERLFEHAERLGIEPRLAKEFSPLLHAQTGAAAVKEAFPELDDEVIQAIARHTAAAPDMTELDMVVYVADLVEPLRTESEIAALRALVGELSLEELFLKALELGMAHLVRGHRLIHPASLEVWNTYVARESMKETADSAVPPQKWTGTEQEFM